MLGRDRNVAVVRKAGVLRTHDERARECERRRWKPGRARGGTGAEARALMTGRVLGRSMLVAGGVRHRLLVRHRHAAHVVPARARRHEQHAVVHGTRMQRDRLRHEGGEPDHQDGGERAMQPVSVHERKDQ